MNLEGTAALVTGGASGLGEACARSLADAGSRVTVLDLRPPSGENESLGQLRFARADVRSEEEVLAALDGIDGPLRVVVNCAGVGNPQRILGKQGVHSLDDFRRILDINLVGTFNVLRLAARVMAENDETAGERGVIVNTASIAAFDGQIGQAAYAASKGALASMTLPAARELAGASIRVAAIAPGLFDTPLFAELPTQVREELANSVPHPRRLGDPSEFAALVRHIAENPMINGDVIRLDGAVRMP